MAAKAVQDAVMQITALEAVPLSDNQPLNEAAPASIVYENIHSAGFVDVNAFANERFEFYTQEIDHISRLNDNLAAGEAFLSLLYAYRSVSRAVPQVQQHDQSNKFEIYERTYEVLRPEVIKMKQLMVFSEKSVLLVKEIVEKVTNERKKDKGVFSSQRFLIKLAETLNMFMVIDALKNMKTSLNNDFAMYKRALSNMKKSAQSGEDETMENQKLYMFLASHDSFSLNLKKELSTLQCEDTLVDLINLCSELYDDQMYIFPETKHVYLKAMAFGLYLIDQDNATEKNNILKNKKIKLERFGKIFKGTPVVPLFGDLSTTIVSILKKAKNIDDTKWAYDAADDSLRKTYMLTTSFDETRAEYRQFVAEFGVMSNEMKLLRASQQPILPMRARVVYDLMLKGCKLVSKWTSMVLEQSAWKFSNPTNPYTNAECPDKATDYEKVVRYNYNSAERFVLIEYITMIKTAKSMMNQALPLVNDVVAQNVYLQLQYFLSGPFAEIIGHVSKKKKGIVSALMLARDIAADVAQATESAAQKGSTIKKGKTLAGASTAVEGVTIAARSVGTSETQLTLLRALLDSAFNEKAPGMKGGFMKDTDFTAPQVAEMTKFFNDSFFYPYMLDLSDTLQRCGDLSELWFKEFYLELSKEIQFPIEMSLPWILTDHILEADAPEYMESVLFPLDLYNDAAHRSLHKLRAQFLYDEIEAEVNLAFDQFIFKLSNNIFTHFKARASSIMLNKEYKHLLEEIFGDQRWDAPRGRFETILQQRHFQLLGRSVDVSKLLSQRMLIFLKRSLDVAISRYESSDFTGILELKYLMEQNRLTHALLSEYLALDPFESLLGEIDEEISLTSFNGRIVTHTVTELLTDVVPNYCYNSVTERFIRAMVQLTDVIQRSHAPKAQPSFLFGSKSLNSAFQQVCNMHSGYIGQVHFSAMIELLGRKYMSVIFGDLAQNCQNTFNTSTSVYTQALIRGMPQSSKLPLFQFGMKGTYDYFSLILKPILTYPYLKSEVFQSFREIGNTILIMHTLDKFLQHDDVSLVVQTAPFLSLRSQESRDVQPDLPSLKDIMAQANDLLASSGTTVKFAEMGARVDELYRPRNASSSLMQQFLIKFNAVLEPFRGEWRGAIPSNDVLEVDFCTEFYRVWSAIQFAFVTPSFNENEFTPRELFGEGLQWAGCTIIHLLGQRHRFEAFDFSMHMINVAIVDKTPLGTVAGVDLSKLVENAIFYRSVNGDIFQLLQRSRPVVNERFGVFHPPQTDGPEGTPGAEAVYDSYPGEHGTAKRIVLQKLNSVAAGP